MSPADLRSAALINREQAPFSCTQTNSGSGAAWVRPVGELDVAMIGELGDALEEAQAHARMVVLDLRGVTFADTTAAHLVVEASLRAALLGRRLITVRGTPDVERVFRMTDTADGIESFDLPPVPQDVKPSLHLVTA